MPRRCSICANPELAAIGKAIAAGASNRSIAERYGVVHTSVQRHRVNCLKSPRRVKGAAAADTPSKPPGTERFESSDPKSLVETTVRLVDEALTVMGHARRMDDLRTALSALREARDGLSLLMKAAGMLGSDSATINVDARKQSVALLSGLNEDEIRSYLTSLGTVSDATENKGFSEPTSANSLASTGGER